MTRVRTTPGPAASSKPAVPWWTTGPLAGMLTALALIAVAQLADPGNGGGGYLRVVFLISLLLIPMSASRYVRGRWGLRRPRSDHDEFVRQIMTRAAARSHGVMLALLSAVFAWLASTGLTGWATPQGLEEWATLGLSFLGIGVGLPVLMAEWAAPTASDEAEEEGV
jgi:GNAT superfamily N-acetyltransferase